VQVQPQRPHQATTSPYSRSNSASTSGSAWPRLDR
jgi:hypothetical protein